MKLLILIVYILCKLSEIPDIPWIADEIKLDIPVTFPKTARPPPLFPKVPSDLPYPECNRLFSPKRADRNYAYTIGAAPLTLIDDEVDLPMDCESIRFRGYYPEQPMSSEEAEFPIAYANIVYTDYVMHEKIFR